MELFFFTWGGCSSCLRACLDAMLLPQESYQLVPKPVSPGRPRSRNRVSGQLRGDKECPISGQTNSGIAWREVPESDARDVLTFLPGFSLSGTDLNFCTMQKEIKRIKSKMFTNAIKRLITYIYRHATSLIISTVKSALKHQS